MSGEGSPDGDKEELELFAESAIAFFTDALVRGSIDSVRSRTLFRLDGGPSGGMFPLAFSVFPVVLVRRGS